MQIYKHASAHTRWCLVWITTSWSGFVRECQASVGLRTWNGSSLFSGMPLLDVCLCCCQWCVNLIILILVHKDIGGLIFWNPPNSWERQRNQGSLTSLPAEKLPSLSPVWTTTYLPHLACRLALPAICPHRNISNKSCYAQGHGLYGEGCWEKDLLTRNIL